MNARLAAILTPKVRRYLYRVAIAALLVAVGYDLITEQAAGLWLVLVAAILGIADRNIPPADGPEPRRSTGDDG